MFENRVLRKIFGPKRNEVIGHWKRLLNELHVLDSSPIIILVIISTRMRLEGQCERKRSLGTPRHK
jgi:hypothetical protein